MSFHNRNSKHDDTHEAGSSRTGFILDSDNDYDISDTELDEMIEDIDLDNELLTDHGFNIKNPSDVVNLSVADRKCLPKVPELKHSFAERECLLKVPELKHSFADRECLRKVPDVKLDGMILKDKKHSFANLECLNVSDTKLDGMILKDIDLDNKLSTDRRFYIKNPSDVVNLGSTYGKYLQKVSDIELDMMWMNIE